MRTKSFFFGLVAIIAGVAFIFAVRDHRARREAEDAALAYVPRREQLSAELRQADQRIVAAEEERRRMQAAMVAARAKIPAAKSEPARQPAATPASLSALRDAILNDPQLQNLQLAAVQAKLLGTYGPLCERLHLSPEQVAQFLGNLRKRDEQEMDISAIQETQHLAADDPVLAKMRAQMTDEFRAAQHALLGNAGLGEFETYQRSVSAREFVNEVAGASVVLGAPIKAAQADALTEAMANASAAYRQGRTATRNIGDIDWDQVLASAARTLTESQFTIFKNAVIQARNMDRIRQLARKG